ncbi:hypothetical protein A1Q1_05422 [Trichosporon asahii var. asahii CBS 2479]|uniref:Uncharacterized protein n=1 Tax=Trichosporon asahii var. asahii (strain ATCC 90039 / CBS 2479 / JCM 2466 / KCTC 7840 / NBRC 103889/ NCYC 2677 / UAMH 7654) TaxID=1186058 RepID=J6ETL5_TRIAS|nr:hypothetical protein A1Q1_05422 [Trichosporon asahii var. asahii CBS 2479]EJT46092.1 hypothetical protein A1Q1_05422 [Trichosporon asahii var. asahii CBS 2479]
MLSCMRDPEAEPVKLILTSPMGFTVEEENKGKDIECTFRSASKRQVESLYADIRPKLDKDFLGSWTTTIVEKAIIADTSLSLRLIRLEDPGPEIVSEAVVKPVPDLVELLAVVELALEYARTPPDGVHAVCGRLDAVGRALDVEGREWVPVGREAEHEGHVV